MDAMDAMDEQQPTTATLAGDDDNTCVVCFDRKKGAALPCGHDHFCSECAKHFRVCPLCREPCAALVHVEGDQGATTVATNDTAETQVLRPSERGLLNTVIVAVWFFIFVGGWVEWCYQIPGRVDGDGHEDSACTSGGGRWCGECQEGWLQGGRGCFASPEDLPPVQVGAALGGNFYFLLIVLTQVAGIVTEIGLIKRVRNILPVQELWCAPHLARTYLSFAHKSLTRERR